jgi:hypothetical protein
MKKLKIGITIGLRTIDDSVWTNGMKLNILYFAKMLKLSSKNYEVCVLNTTNIDVTEKPKYFKDIDLFDFKQKYQDIDLLICMGSQVEKQYLQYFEQQPNKKAIGYRCGNNYIIGAEDVLFKDGQTSYEFETELEEIWYVPQQHETNYGYYKTLYRTNPVIVPFVWDHSWIVESLADIERNYKIGNFKKSYKYDNTKEKKVIGIMEPNLNIVKYCLLPTMIAEESYRSEVGKNKIDKLLITNSEKVANHKGFLSTIKTFDLYQDGKIFAESRYQTAWMLTQNLDVLICHQILNPLNYLYLDAAFMGYPVLHNAPMCKDIGYYYEGCDTIEGAEKLNWILENHDTNILEYSEKNSKGLWRYHIHNKDIIKTYDDLIYNLFNGGNHNLVYNEKTNLYKKKNIKNKKIKNDN